ncbi:hypothetical protein [Solemya velum gill symbiont]|uniref:hypothetical protein n=1 Tax=Solemya velum gill symbiont TaxID=2340 RepID=UPI00099781DD|nr:hypothetical protein [Solemya velum gill symbiont]OOY50273.1 hypothetical protein BOV97_11650 [Solemya velum gill symbiont]OOY54464.1 hypothetical protein BOV99_11050 [Solemya velum gill symbiont]OOY54881.1 hypothetical protein BOW00_11055 [Solemya velum gill symbiont]OOY59157.1 hypothetical protein BOW02_11060 [Solemya velum gill symbiont]OOY60354.1 hypothetical protein BOW04_11490 [Solemya velum gill symbiont]
MFIARWIIDVRFGRKDDFIKRIQQWYEEVGEKVGLTKNHLRVNTGSIEAMESRFEFDHSVESLEALQTMWDMMVKLDSHTKFGSDLEPLIVPGSSHWEIFRTVDL